MIRGAVQRRAIAGIERTAFETEDDTDSRAQQLPELSSTSRISRHRQTNKNLRQSTMPSGFRNSLSVGAF